MAYVVFDIGGTNTRVAVSRDGKNFSGEPRIFETSKSFEGGVAAIAEAARSLAATDTITSAGGGIAGPLDKERGALVNTSNLGEWVGKPLKEKLRQALGVPVVLENDSAIVGLGEAMRGAGRGFSIVAYLTISTGVGGARIVDGRIDRSAFGFEPGHQILGVGDAGEKVTDMYEAEEYLSGASTQLRYGKKPYEVHDPAVWEELSVWLAYLLNNVIVMWSPDVVVVGGPMVYGNPKISLERAKEHLAKIITIFPEYSDIREAELKEEGGLYGALELLMGRQSI